MGHFLTLYIADLALCLEIDRNFPPLIFLPSHSAFRKNLKAEVQKPSAFSDLLNLKVKQKSLSRHETWVNCLFRTEIWELWRDCEDNYVFYNPTHDTVRQVNVTPDFSSGQLLGDFYPGNKDGVELIPQGLEIVLFSNWLAFFGDLILHASGIALDGKGYAFVGRSGAGKSTLVSSLVNQQSLTVLGEDQVILRLKDGNFWIYGTPWHINPDMCSPTGVPLAGVFFLDRSRNPGIQSITPAEGIAGLLKTAFVPYYRLDALDGILSHLDKLMSSIPCYSLSYTLGTDLLPLIRIVG